VTRIPHRSAARVGDLFALFPDLPWPRISPPIEAARAARRVAIVERVHATRMRAALARARFSAAIARYAKAAARRRAAVRRRKL